jgi:hypothetical protein
VHRGRLHSAENESVRGAAGDETSRGPTHAAPPKPPPAKRMLILLILCAFSGQSYRCRVEITGEWSQREASSALALSKLAPHGCLLPCIFVRPSRSGKALTGAVLAYGAFYLKSYLVDRECIRKDAQFVNRQHGVVGRPIKLTDPSSLGK